MTELPLIGAHARRAGRLCWLVGVVAVATGVLCLVWPGHSVLVVTLLVAAALLVGGISSLVGGLRMRPARGSGSVVAWGGLGIIFAMLIAWHPGMSTAVLVVVTGLAVLSGGLLLIWLAAAVRVIGGRWEALPGVGGLLAVVVGLYFVFAPGEAVKVLGVLLGVLALLVGSAFLVLGTRLTRIGAPGKASEQQPRAVNPNTVIIEGTVTDTPPSEQTPDPRSGPDTSA